MRPIEVARQAGGAGQDSQGNSKGKKNGAEKTAAIKVGRDSGRVKVFVRVRPMKPQENSRKETVVVDVSELQSSIHVNDPKHSWEKDYPFDHVFPSDSTNQEVCNTLCKPIVNAALNGFNGTLMAYGQTGSGKTYTLMAPDGVVAGVVDRCFKRIMQDIKHDYKVSMSYLQIYQEKIYDLLNSTNKVELNIREHPHKGVYVENLSEFVVRSPSEIMNLLAVGKKRLVFAETKMNRTSSRSHSVCILLIERTLNKGEGKKSKDCVPNGDRRSPHPRKDSREHLNGSPKHACSPKRTLASSSSNLSDCASEIEDEEQDSLAKMTFTDDVLVRGKIHLCDLAGSERLKKTHAEGDRLSEAQHINSSLLELGNVIHALADGKQTHVPFRNSTLTRLLQESLGGNCKTSLMVCVSPTITDVSETKSTLSFGSRAMKVTNTAYVNVEVDYKKLSDDLTKMLDSREKDMERLKESFETRIEKIKSEAETMLNTSMTTAQDALEAVRNLFESKETSLLCDIQQIDHELQKEKSLSNQLQQQLSSLGNSLHGGVNRAKSALLAELLSMQLFYVIRDMPEEERHEAAKQVQNEYLYSGKFLLYTKERVLENTDSVLELFQSYLKLLNISGDKLTDNGFDIKNLEENISSEEPNLSFPINNHFQELNRDFSKSKAGTLEQNLLLLQFNKSDDDKVFESTKINAQLASQEQEPHSSNFLSLTKSLQTKLRAVKRSLDGDAIEFLKKAFGIKRMAGETERSKEHIYGVMVEFLRERENQQDHPRENQVIPMLLAEMALLDQSLCHVLVDKALQSAVLLLEHTETERECAKLLNNNSILNKELEMMRLQIETLVCENTKLNAKLSETSNFLRDVKTSKTMLEKDLSSVFQLYNMKTEKSVEKSPSQMKKDLQEGISSLVEENAKLKVELKDSRKQNKELETQLNNTKEELLELQKLVESFQKGNRSKQSTNSRASQTENTLAVNGNISDFNESNGVEKSDVRKSQSGEVDVTSNGGSQVLDINNGISENNASPNKSTSKKLEEVERFLLKLQDELNNLEDDESALFTHANQRQAVSALRMDLNKRLGELWSIDFVESKKLRESVDELTKKLEYTRDDYEKQIDELERELTNESQARLSLENELIQYRKDVMDLGVEVWSTSQSNDGKDVEFMSDSSRETSKESGFRSTSTSDVQDNEPHRKAEVNGSRKHSNARKILRRSSTHESDSDDSLYEKRNSNDLFQAEVDTKNAKVELLNLKKTFIELNQELADSGKIRQELEERFVELVNENNAISLKFKATEEQNKVLEEKLNHISTLKTSLQDELLKEKSLVHVQLEDIRNYKEKIANFEVERTTLKQELSEREIKFTEMDNKYKGIERELAETKERLQAYEDEINLLRNNCETLTNQVEDESDRESLVEVKMKGGQRRDSATPSRIQSIHLVSRSKSQLNKKASYLANKKKVTIKKSPRLDENSPRRSTIKRGTVGKTGILTSPSDSKPLTRDTDRSALKRTRTSERRAIIKRDTDEDHKLKSELLLAKEQLIRLKGELTLSNIQTANLGTHLTSLREDSNKLEVELSSMRRTPNSNETDQDVEAVSSGNKNVDIELAGAKEKIIELQDKILSLRREKATSVEKVSESEEELKRLRSEVYKSRDSLERSQEVVTILKKEMEVLTIKNQILQERLTNYSNETTRNVIKGEMDVVDDEESQNDMKIDKDQLAYYEKDRFRLQKEVEELSNDKVRLEDMKNLVQKLVDVEDEQMVLKRRLRKAVKEVDENESEEVTSEDTKKNHSSSNKISLKMNEFSQMNTSKDKFEEYYVENTALRCEVDALRIYIANLENEIKSMKYKLSISESMQGNKDKKTLAVLLASAKHEREELRETLNNVYSEKEDMEEALTVARMKSERLQRELSHVSKKQTQLEMDLIAITNGSAVPEKDRPTSSLSTEEERLVEVIKGFLYNIGVQNAEEKDILDLAKSFLSRDDQVRQKKIKGKSMENKQPWTKIASTARNITKKGSATSKTNSKPSSFRHGAQANASNPKTHTSADTSTKLNDSYSKLKRPKPETARGVPEGMETEKSIVTKIDNNLKQQDVKVDEITDDTDLMFEHNVEVLQNVKEVVFIKRAWSLKDLFKRTSSEVKSQAREPSVVSQ